jgi:hypothetical protein
VSTETDISLLYVLSFDYPLLVDANILGLAMQISLPSGKARLELPRAAASPNFRTLLPPSSANFSLGSHLKEGWGFQHDSDPRLEINAVLVVFPVQANLSFDLQRNQIGGEGVQAVLREVTDWFESFCHWIWVLTSQPLDPMNPDPKVLHRRSSNVIFAGATSTHFSLPASGSPPLTIILDIDGGPTSERLVDRQVLELTTSRCGQLGPPLMWELLASSRMAGRRGNWRVALLDSATAAEAALSSILSIALGHTFTLGGLVTKAQENALSIPADIKTALVQPRNNAVHRGQTLNANPSRAIAIAEELVSMADSEYVRASSLKAVSRPQRLDLTLIQAPSASTDGTQH